MSRDGSELIECDPSTGCKQPSKHQQRSTSHSNRNRLQDLIRKYALRQRPLAARANDEYRPCPYVPTPQPILDAVLSRIAVRNTDVFIDLGCGDGRLAIAVAEHYGCRAIGIEYDERILSKALQGQASLRQRNEAAARRLCFFKHDFFAPEIENILGEATIVWLFLTPRVQRRLLPVLLSSLKVGARIICYVFPLETSPDAVIDVSDVIPNHQLTLVYVHTVTAELKQSTEHDGNRHIF